ncbi:MAG: hypothetical protein FWB86_09680 [Treponema sp.]|nr:hypothetical protein [Treponema sp.]MCL2251922.1 hypothetical protein [Treponema sp.]
MEQNKYLIFIIAFFIFIPLLFSQEQNDTDAFITEEFNRTSDELIDTLLNDPGNNEKILSLSGRLYVLADAESPLFANFIERASQIEELRVHRNLIRDILIKGQELQEGGYFISYSENAAKIVQRLTWESDINTMQYEIIIINNNTNEEVFRKITTDNFVEISLHPGIYLFNITPYDFLSFPGDPSEWMEIEILHAFQPRIEKYSPNIFYLDQRAERIIYLTGVNLSEESVIYLRSKYNKSFEQHPVKVRILNDKRAMVYFDDRGLVTGTYDICVVNPGGIEARAGNFDIGYRKPMDIFYRMSLNPVIPLSGEVYDFFGSGLFLSGLTAAFEFVSSKRATFNGGVEFSASIFFINNALKFATSLEDWFKNLSTMDYSVAFTEINLNILFQKRIFNEKVAFTFRFGCGTSTFYGLGENVFSAHLNVGGSLLFMIVDIFHLDIGVDLSHYFIVPAADFIKPKIGFAWKF